MSLQKMRWLRLCVVAMILFAAICYGCVDRRLHPAHEYDIPSWSDPNWDTRAMDLTREVH